MDTLGKISLIYSSPALKYGKKEISPLLEWNSETSEISIGLSEVAHPFSVAFAVSTVPVEGKSKLHFGFPFGKSKKEGEEPDEDVEVSNKRRIVERSAFKAKLPAFSARWPHFGIKMTRAMFGGRIKTNLTTELLHSDVASILSFLVSACRFSY